MNWLAGNADADISNALANTMYTLWRQPKSEAVVECAIHICVNTLISRHQARQNVIETHSIRCSCGGGNVSPYVYCLFCCPYKTTHNQFFGADMFFRVSICIDWLVLVFGDVFLYAIFHLSQAKIDETQFWCKLIKIFHFFISQKMQVESGLGKWNGRVPPLDLSNVSVCPRETEQRWHKIQPNSRQMNFEAKRSSDGLPIGESPSSLLVNRMEDTPFEDVFPKPNQNHCVYNYSISLDRSTWLVARRRMAMANKFIVVGRTGTDARISAEVSHEWQSVVSDEFGYVFGTCSGRW